MIWYTSAMRIAGIGLGWFLLERCNSIFPQDFGSISVESAGFMDSGKESDSAADTPTSPKNVCKDPDDGRQRFPLELEFVKCLANPTYILTVYVPCWGYSFMSCNGRLA